MPGTLARVAQQFWGLRYIDDAVARRIDVNADGDYIDDDAQDPPVEGEGTWFYITDVQFSAVAMLTESGVLAERVRYDAYGRARHHRAGDIDGDGDADGTDLLTLLDNTSGTWGQSIGDPYYNVDADLDRDGTVEIDDYGIFALSAGSALPFGYISDPLGADNPIGYDGYVFVPEAGLNIEAPDTLPEGVPPTSLGAYLVRHRWFSPEIGKWLQRDPLGYVNGANTGEYGMSSPATRGDPFGLCTSGSTPKLSPIRTESLRQGFRRLRNGLSDIVQASWGGDEQHRLLTEHGFRNFEEALRCLARYNDV